MKKVLAIMLALVLAVGLFSACGSEGVSVNEEEVIKQKVSEYIDLSFSGDKAALSYVKEGTEIYTETEEIIKQFDSMKDLGDIPESYADALNEKVRAFADKIRELANYEITAVSVDGDKATATVKMTVPDFTQAEKVDAGTLLLQSFDLDEIMALQSGSEEDQGKFMIEFIGVYCDAILEEIKKGSQEDESDFSFEKTDGNWIIVSSGDDAE